MVIKDLGFTGVVSLTSTGTMTGSPLSCKRCCRRVNIFRNYSHRNEIRFTMNATVTGLTSITSNAFDIVTVTVLVARRFCYCCSKYLAELQTGSADEITFVSFKDISVGTQILNR